MTRFLRGVRADTVPQVILLATRKYLSVPGQYGSAKPHVPWHLIRRLERQSQRSVVLYVHYSMGNKGSIALITPILPHLQCRS